MIEIKRENIQIVKANRIRARIYLSIVNKEYDIFRAFENLNLLIEHLKKYPIENKESIIKEIEAGGLRC